MTTPHLPPLALPVFSEGQKIAGSFVLKKMLCAGNPALIWLATDEVLGKEVSLHWVPREVSSDPEALAALRGEIKRMRQAIHPQILRVYDLVEEPEWTAISMDAFEGETLASRLAQTPHGFFEVEEVQPWATQLCQVLDDAHRIGLVHRGVSPDNVLIGPAGKLTLLNFGISRCLQDALRRVRDGGTDQSHLAYTSPQLLDRQPPARTDDVYATGILFFELLTGTVPFERGDMLSHIRKTVPRLISQQRVHSRKSGGVIPVQWDRTVAACVEKNAALRPKSMSEVANRLSMPAETPAIAPVAPITATIERPVILAKAIEPDAAPAMKVLPPDLVKASERTTTKIDLEDPPLNEQDVVSDVFPSLYPRRPRSPMKGIAVAVALISVGLGGLYFSSLEFEGDSTAQAANDFVAPEEPADASALTSVNNAIPAETSVSPEDSEPQASEAGSIPTEPDQLENPPIILTAAAAPKPQERANPATPAVSKTPAPAETPAASAAAPSASPEKAVAERTAALEKLRQSAEATEKARLEMVKQQQQAETELAEARKIFEEKTQAAAPMKKPPEELAALRKKKEDEQKAAEAAAQAAQQLAQEKAKLAEEAKQALAELDKQGKERMALQEKAEAELQTLQKAMAEKQRVAAEAAKATADAETARQQQLAAVTAAEKNLADAKLAVEQAAEMERVRLAKEDTRKQIEKEFKELEAMKAAFQKKMEELEAKRRTLDEPIAKPVTTPQPATDKEPAKPLPGATTSDTGAKPAETTLAMKTDPKPPQLVPSDLTKPSTPGTVENSLGMKFAPVGDVQFSIWLTRVKDFETFAKAKNLKSTAWRGPGFKQGPDHPVVNVSWVEAMAFCTWLTERERKEGKLPAGQIYRLPTDMEWSKAVGLPEETGKTPEARDMEVQDVYPWGTQWPPPPGAGNYTGEETGSDVAIKGYDDGFAWTAPVGSFPAGKYGLYDMGGNVWQWCMDTWNNESKHKVLRGASWYNGAIKLSLLSSCRVHAAPDSSTDNNGFRVVRAFDSGKSGKKGTGN